MYFDSEFFGLSNGAISRAIPALLPGIQTALVTNCVSKLEHIDEIRWAGYTVGGAHIIDPHMGYQYSLFKNSMRLLKTKK